MANCVFQKPNRCLPQIINLVNTATWPGHWLKGDSIEVAIFIIYHLIPTCRLSLNWHACLRVAHSVKTGWLFGDYWLGFSILHERSQWNGRFRATFSDTGTARSVQLKPCCVSYLFLRGIVEADATASTDVVGVWLRLMMLRRCGELRTRIFLNNILVFVNKVYFKIRRRLVASRSLLSKSLNWSLFFHYLFWGRLLLPILQFFFDEFLSIRWLNFRASILLCNRSDDALLRSFQICTIFLIFNGHNRIHSFIRVIVFIELIPLRGTLPLRQRNTRVRCSELPSVALFFHVKHNLPDVVFILLLYVEIGGIVMIQIIP